MALEHVAPVTNPAFDLGALQRRYNVAAFALFRDAESLAWHTMPPEGVVPGSWWPWVRLATPASGGTHVVLVEVQRRGGSARVLTYDPRLYAAFLHTVGMAEA